MTDKEKQRELIVEIMKADEQSGLYTTRKQTAVDWLFQELWDRPKDKMVWYYILEKAKQMEKEQIKEAHLNGQSEWDIKALEDINKKLSEEYYKETYE
jgi:hypothetical protein